MGRFGIDAPTPGVIKSIQTFSASGTNGSSTTTTNVTISAVVEAKTYIINNGSGASSYGSNWYDSDDQSYGMSSPYGARLTSSTNLALEMRDLDAPIVHSRTNGTAKGFIVETT